jgi:hypothetical protein
MFVITGIGRKRISNVHSRRRPLQFLRSPGCLRSRRYSARDIENFGGGNPRHSPSSSVQPRAGELQGRHGIYPAAEQYPRTNAAHTLEGAELLTTRQTRYTSSLYPVCHVIARTVDTIVWRSDVRKHQCSGPCTICEMVSNSCSTRVDA